MTTLEKPVTTDISLNALSREDQAKLEIGHTDIGPAAKWMLVLCFLATIVAVPAVQFCREWLSARTQHQGSFVPQSLEIFREIPKAADAWHHARGGFISSVMRANSTVNARVKVWRVPV